MKSFAGSVPIRIVSDPAKAGLTPRLISLAGLAGNGGPFPKLLSGR